MFCYQQNFFTQTKEVDSGQFWALVEAPYTRECITKFRETGDTAWKKRLPAFVFQATFDETLSKKGARGAWRKQAATRLTGLVVMDIDHIGEPLPRPLPEREGSKESLTEREGSNMMLPPRELFAKWQAEHPELFPSPLRGDKRGALLVYITPSGHGLKVVFKADPEVGNLIDNQHHMARLLGVEVDESCKDASRLSFICMKEDILFINEDELFTYENKEFAEKYNDVYRGGHSQPTLFAGLRAADGAHGGAAVADGADGTRGTVGGEDADGLYRGVSYQKIIDAWLDGTVPGPGDRHQTALKLASDLRYITDNDAALIRRLLMAQTWVQDIVRERGEDIDLLIGSARDYKQYQTVPKRMQQAVEKAGARQGAGRPWAPLAPEAPENLARWGQEIGTLAEHYPCMAAIGSSLAVEGRPAALYVGAAFLGTLMTRCTYRFYHRPEELRRLNYCVMVIGDPASGKSFATRLYKLLAAPIRVADKVGYDAINRYKEERRERTTSSKAQKQEALKKPEVVIRDHPARTSNATFIDDMNHAVEVVDGEPMHLHMLTFDSELDNATQTQRGGSWIDKSAMELKAFHNEEDGQAYSNVESVSGTFNVYWNFVYTGTPLSLQRKVSERNFGSGLATRLGVVPLPPTNFQMMALRKTSATDAKADEELRQWAFRLDQTHGELPLWPLVEHCWQWTNEQMEMAAFEQSKAQELLLKRVAYYGIALSAPFIVMRHWEEWTAHHTLTIDDTDRRLCSLCLEMQYECQKMYFGAYAQAYFDNMERDRQSSRTKRSKFDDCYNSLPQLFTPADVERIYNVEHDKVRFIVMRLKSKKLVVKTDTGEYKKLQERIF